MNEREIFTNALKHDAADRKAYLDRACRGDADLRKQVEALLAEQAQLGSFLESPPPALARTVDEPSFQHGPGARIGPYKLLEQIGEGGMGVVYMAAQTHPVERKVALKLIKPGLDTRQVLSRFDAERQALALMDHPNIAKVFDAGTTESGQPYFVMELVNGVPITEYCDTHRLPPRERLELFVPVCKAVQHAHQKGVIHRDLKPSNVMVVQYDGNPVPKVIDFGVAKATGPKLTEETLYTGFGTVVGTLEYMSPEQAVRNQLDVDTRSDIYSLGVLLYELLTGTTPLDHKRAKEAAVLELLRVIQEEDPPKPSMRLSSTDELPSIAANRGVDPKRLSLIVRGDLDWIVMKALDKDRTRRYETANGLARDLDRYLHDEPVEARPPSAVYRLKKFAGRNRGAVITATLVTVALLAGTIVSTWQALRARAAAASEKAAKVEAQAREVDAKEVLSFLEKKIFAAARPRDQAGGLGFDVKLADALKAALPFVEKSFPNQPLVEARLRMTLGQSYYFLGEFQSASEQEEAARALYTLHRGLDDRDTLKSMHLLAVSYSELGRHDDALKLHQQTLAHQKAALGADDYDTLLSMTNLANCYFRMGRHAEALKLYEDTLALQKSKLGATDPLTLTTMNNLANSYFTLNRMEEALKLREETLALRKATIGRDHPDTLMSMFNLAGSYYVLGRHRQSLNLSEETLALQKSKLGPDHPNTLKTMTNVANCYQMLGRLPESLKLREETLALQKSKLGLAHPDTLISMNNLANGYDALGRHTDALKLRVETLAVQKAKLGPDHPDTLRSMNNLAMSYGEVGRLDESRKLSQETLARSKATLGPDHPDTLFVIDVLAETELRLGLSQDALKRRQELLAIRRTKFGPHHPRTLTTMFDTADSYMAVGRPAEAFQLYEQTLADQKATLGPDHPSTLETMNGLANCQEALGRHAEALKLRQETLAHRKSKLGPDHPYTLETMWGLAKSLAALHRESEAMPIIDECLKRATGKDVGPQLLPGLVELRLRICERSKDGAGCRRTAEMWEALNRTDAMSLYTAARLRAVTAAVLRTPTATLNKTARQPVDAGNQADAEAERAMGWLKQAITAGYKDTAHIKQDKDLESLRSREEFKKLVANLATGNEAAKKP
jgi:serine/threonine protein kinase/tetratricopeptide (TPR) repeat protein